MFCPDCGKQSGPEEQFCYTCGYPLYKLEERLKQEEEESMGWAEKIIGKPKFDVKPPPEPPLKSFAEVPKPLLEPEKSEGVRICDMCGAKVHYGALCHKCNDKLPAIMDADPFLQTAFSGLLRIFFTPRYFAQNFPYPITGGTTQPNLYPGVFGAVFVMSIPFTVAEWWLGKTWESLPILVAITGLILALLFTPILVYLSAGIIHLVSRVLGRVLPYRRSLRIFSAVCVITLFIGIIVNLTKIGFYFYEPQVTDFASQFGISMGDLESWIAQRRDHLTALFLITGAWIFGWIFGGLYRFNWWKSLILVFASYWLIYLAWAIFYVFSPLYFSGLLGS